MGQPRAASQGTLAPDSARQLRCERCQLETKAQKGSRTHLGHPGPGHWLAGSGASLSLARPPPGRCEEGRALPDPWCVAGLESRRRGGSGLGEGREPPGLVRSSDSGHCTQTVRAQGPVWDLGAPWALLGKEGKSLARGAWFGAAQPPSLSHPPVALLLPPTSPSAPPKYLVRGHHPLPAPVSSQAPHPCLSPRVSL